jgi:hypothetical protein
MNSRGVPFETSKVPSAIEMFLLEPLNELCRLMFDHEELAAAILSDTPQTENELQGHVHRLFRG